MKHLFRGLGGVILIIPLPTFMFMHAMNKFPNLEAAPGILILFAYIVLIVMACIGTWLCYESGN